MEETWNSLSIKNRSEVGQVLRLFDPFRFLGHAWQNYNGCDLHSPWASAKPLGEESTACVKQGAPKSFKSILIGLRGGSGVPLFWAQENVVAFWKSPSDMFALPSCWIGNSRNSEGALPLIVYPVLIVLHLIHTHRPGCSTREGWRWRLVLSNTLGAGIGGDPIHLNMTKYL